MQKDISSSLPGVSPRITPLDHLPKPLDMNSLDSYKILPTGGETSMISRVICKEKLPIAIRLRKEFSCKDSPVVLTNGELLLICFVVEVPVVLATLGKNTKYRLPIYASQLYERLPNDPSLDDKVYDGTKALIEAKPLPQEVRVLDAMYSDDTKASQVSGDVITALKIDTQFNAKTRTTEKVLAGVDKQGNEVQYSEAMHLSSYTTMICPEFLPLSELVKFAMPQRVRFQDSIDSRKWSRKNREKKVMTLQKFLTEYHVITARATDNMLLSIPIATQLEFDVVDSTLRGVSPLLPAIFNRTNVTLGVTDVTQSRLPANLRAVSQPLQGVIETWIKSYEGDKLVCKAHKQSVERLIQIVSRKDSEIFQLKKELARFRAQTEKKPWMPRCQSDKIRREPRPHVQPRHSTWDTSKSASRFFARYGFRKESSKHEYLSSNDTTPDNEPTYEEAPSADVVEPEMQEDAIYEDIDIFDDKIYFIPVNDTEVLSQLTCEDVLDFLNESHLSGYCEIFKKENIDGKLLCELSEDLMVGDLGMRKLDARKLTVKLKAEKDKYVEQQQRVASPKADQ